MLAPKKFRYATIKLYMRRTLLLLIAFTLLFTAAAATGGSSWPHWRGPNDDGMAVGDAPLKWSDTEHVAWKTNIPGRGFSSPVIWEEKIFLTTALPTGTPAAPVSQETTSARAAPRSAPPSEHKLMVMALDRKSGKILWEKLAKTATPHEGYHPMYGSFASNSPVTDGKHVIAFFGSRGVYCYTLDGKLVWEKDFGVQLKMRLSFGEGSWPTLDGNKLILLFDQEGGDSFLLTLDKNTGKELWRVARPNDSNWSGPYVTTVNGKKQVVVSATKKVIAYDLETGKSIWEVGGLGINTIPAPVAADGLIFVMSGFRNQKLLAVKLGRDGDLTGTDAIVWTADRGLSYTPSPVLHDGKLYIVTDNGQLSCFDAKTGKAYYQQQRLPKPYNFKASLVGANGKLYLAAEDGDVIVVKMGETFEILATNTLKDQTFISTPAIAGGEIFLRSQNTLFCIR